MKLQELIDRLRELSDNGYAQFEVEANIDARDEEFNDCTADLINKVLSIN